MVDAHFHSVAMARKHEQFQAKAKAQRQACIRAEQANGPTVISIDSVIGQEPGELSAKWLRGQLPVDGRDVVLQIHCEGGSVFEALAMIDVLTAYRGQAKAVVSSMALSAASLLLTACDEIEVTPNAYLMLHNAHMNDSELSETERDLLNSLSERMVGMYSTRSGQPASKIRQMMDAETFLDAAESVRLGFADRVVSPSNLRIVARSIPRRIVARMKSPAQTAVARWNKAVQACGNVNQADKQNPGLRLKMLAEVNSKR